MHRLTSLLATCLRPFAPASVAQVESGQTFTARVGEEKDGYGVACERPPGRR